MIIRMLIIHLGMIHLLLVMRWGGIGIGCRILRVIVIVAAVEHRWIRVRMMNWCWWLLIKAIEISFIVVVCVGRIHCVRLVIGIVIVIPIIGLSLRLMMVHRLHVMIVIFPRSRGWLLVLKNTKNYTMICTSLLVNLPRNHRALVVDVFARTCSNIARWPRSSYTPPRWSQLVVVSAAERSGPWSR